MKHLLFWALIATVLTSLSCSQDQADAKINVVLILLDTVNADHLGCYGYVRDTSPTIDSLAETGIIYMNCQAQAPWTLPSMASILTGLTERSHGCGQYLDGPRGLDLEVPTLATLFKGDGYSTCSLVNIAFLAEPFGMAKDYDYFWSWIDWDDKADIIVDRFLEHLRSGEMDEPFFTTIHFFDPHLPYDPPPPYDKFFKSSGTGGVTEWPAWESCYDPVIIEHMTALYDSEIRWTDSQLSRLLAGMRELGLTENTIFVLVADHGEEFMEHGDYGHSRNLYQEALHVPLIITGPGIQAGGVVFENVAQIDILPTLLNFLEIDAPENVEGIDLFAEIPENRIIPSSGVMSDTKSVASIQGSQKVIWFVESDSSETFNLAEDPGELILLTTDSLLLEKVTEYWAWPCICTPTQNTDAIIEMKRLHDLGYIN